MAKKKVANEKAEENAKVEEVEATPGKKERKPVYHTFGPRDNRLIISQKYKVTVEALARLNPEIDSWFKVKEGQKIRVK